VHPFPEKYMLFNFDDPYLWQWLGIEKEEEGVFPAHICQAL
jgi:hypothetical protein